jgi:hypothetical protein
LRTYVADRAGNAVIVLAIPDTITLSGFFLDNVNFDSFETVTYRDDLTGAGSTQPFTINEDTRTGRRKAYCTFTAPIGFDADSSSTAKIAFKVNPAATMYGSQTKAEFGSITLIEDGKEPIFPYGHMKDMAININYPQVVNKFAGGNQEPISIGERFVDITLPALDFLRDTQESAIMDILQKEQTPVVFYENNDETQKVYTVRLDSAKAIRQTYKVSNEVFSVQLKFREVI